MTIGTPLSLGTTSGSAVTQLILTTSVNAANPGDLILVSAAGVNGITNVTDDNGNTYIPYLNTAAQALYLFACENSAGLAIGGKITINFSGAPANHSMGAAAVSGMRLSSVLDGSSTDKTGSGTGYTSNPVVGTSANELIWSITTSSTAAFTGFAANGTFTLLQSATASYGLRVCFKITTQTADDPISPTWTSSVAFHSRVARLFGLDAPVVTSTPSPGGGAVVGGRRRQILGRTKPQAEARWTRETPPAVIKPAPVTETKSIDPAPKPQEDAGKEGQPPVRVRLPTPIKAAPKIAKPTGPTWADMERARVELTRLRQELADQQDEDDVELLLMTIH